MRALGFALCIFLAPAPARAGDVAAQIEAALRLSANDPTVVGVHVVTLPVGRTVCSVNADVPFKPASNMKLLTTAAAIDVLGRDFAFETACRIVRDDLFIVGGGDPLPAHPRAPPTGNADPFEIFYQWADQLIAHGFSTIPGDLIIDERVFDSQWTNPAWPEDQLHKHYCAPVGGLNLHGNCITARVIPGNGADELVRYVLTPTNPWIRLDNRCRTGNKGLPWLSRNGDGAEYVLAGTCSRETTLGLVTVPDPGMFFGTTLRTYLGAKGIRIAGRVRRPGPAELMLASPFSDAARHVFSPHVTPLTDVLRCANTDSINLAAEALFKMIGRVHESAASGRVVPGTWDRGRRAVRAFLRRINLDDPRVVIADGSGLSHDNRLTPRLMTGLLTHIFSSPERDLYVDSLARSGIDGTLRRRMKDIPGRFRGKTGYIEGVRTLSGYLQTDDGTWLALSIMHNGFSGPSSRYRDAQDHVCRILAEYAAASQSASNMH